MVFGRGGAFIWRISKGAMVRICLRKKREILKKLTEDGLVEIRDGFLRPTRAGMAVADSLALI